MADIVLIYGNCEAGDIFSILKNGTPEKIEGKSAPRLTHKHNAYVFQQKRIVI